VNYAEIIYKIVQIFCGVIPIEKIDNLPEIIGVLIPIYIGVLILS
jgi:hypothetical protein